MDEIFRMVGELYLKHQVDLATARKQIQALQEEVEKLKQERDEALRTFARDPARA